MNTFVSSNNKDLGDMALMGYNPKRKHTPPPVASLEIYHDVKSLEIPTSEGCISIRSQLLTAISLIPNSKSDGDSEPKSRSTPRCRKHTERPPTPSNGQQFLAWRSSDSKSSKDASRSKSLSPNQWSSDKPKVPSMKRSATFSGKFRKKSKVIQTKQRLDDYRNAKIKGDTGMKWMTSFCKLFMILLVVVVVIMFMWFFMSSTSTPPYDHKEVLINTTSFQKYLKHNFFSQTHTINFLQEILREELNGEKHEQPLVLSFHGGPGVGKTFLAEAIAKHLFTKGLDSPCMHNFISSLHIRSREPNVNHEVITRFLQQSSSVRCPLELFIIDNMDILTPKLVNYLSQGIQQSLLDSSIVKSTILIFTSTLGEKQIFKMRDCVDDMCYLETTEMIKKELQSWKPEKTMKADEDDNSPDGSLIFPESSTILVFFPLRRQHVKLCALRVLQQHLPSTKITDGLLESVASEISFIYIGGKGYSSSGCKQIAEKAILHL